MARGREPSLRRPLKRAVRAKEELRYLLGANLHAIRLARRVTTHELERRTGIRRGAIRYYEAGKGGVITLRTLQRLAGGLGCEVVDFFQGDRGGQEEARVARGR